MQEAFNPNSPYRLLLLTTIFTGLAFGIQKGMLDNFLVEVVGMNQMDRGVAEFFRELPGVLLIFILAVFYTLSAETLYKSGIVIMLVGLGMYTVLPPDKVLMTLTVFLFSLGDHIQFGVRSSLVLAYSKEGRGGAALGVQYSINEIGMLVGYLIIVLAFSLFAAAAPYRIFFAVAAVLLGGGVITSLHIHGKNATDENKRRFRLQKKYHKYYMLEMFYGARKQVFMTFGPYVLILFYGANAAAISLLFAVSAVACSLLSPLVGRIIDRIGYKTVMVADTLILVIVCFFYGFAHHFLPMKAAYLVCCANYVLDAVISMASMASNVYVQDLAETAEEVPVTISTGVSINHLISIFIALFGGWIWKTLGIELLFILSAVLGLCNSAYAASIKTSTVRKEKSA
ncbi:MAG: MFS transporter [Ruminococcaceae bacterium]|nr:MFS transporter [Oscillospiraceae bacterium]